jgi:hypothetical protein
VIDLEGHQSVCGRIEEEPLAHANTYLAVVHGEVDGNDHGGLVGGDPNPADQFEIGGDG